MNLYYIPLVLGLVHLIYIVIALIFSQKIKECAYGNKYSVEHIVCFKNEAKFIEKKLKSCYEIDYPHIHRTFVNDNSDDETWELLNKYKQDNTRLINNTFNLGKNQSQIKSVKQTDADLLLFTDANVFLEKNALSCIINHFDENTGGVCGDVTITTDMQAQDFSGKYWELEKKIKDFQTLSGAVIGFDGGFYCVRKENYNLKRENELSDFETAFLIFEQGKKTQYAKNAIAVELEKRKLKSSFMARIRASNRVFWSFYRIFKYINKLKPDVLFHLLFHKLLRYVFIVSLIFCLPFLVLDMAKYSPLFLAVFFIPFVSRFIIESAALCIGGIIALTGKEYTTWSNQKV